MTNRADRRNCSGLRMPWAGDSSILIDRFDGRALLDYLPTEPASVVDSGLRPDRDEDGIGNELRFERWHDLADKIRLHVPEEQCVLENEEEWNDLVVRHHALIGKASEKKRDNNPDSATSRPSFGFDYGTTVVQPESAIGQASEKELTALEEENVFDHLDDLTARERDSLDSLGKSFFIKDYFRVLRVAKEEEDERVNQLKVTAVNLERALTGKKPLKASEIEGLASSPAKNQGRGGQISRRHRNRRKRSRSPTTRGARRSSPSYEPYQDSSSRSGSESPSKEKVEFIQEFKIGSPKQDNDSGGDYDYYDMETSTSPSTLTKGATSRTSATTKDAVASMNQLHTTSNRQGVSGIGATKSSLAEKLKQRMRQGLEQSVRAHDAKKQAKTQGYVASIAGDSGHELATGESRQDQRVSSESTNVSPKQDPRRSGQREEGGQNSSTKRRKSRSRSRSPSTKDQARIQIEIALPLQLKVTIPRCLSTRI
ncbi:hypothetical protein BGX24_009814 [Mortierella sp. AD032]|nr:hypothetical protein BGX24_009814 [Mortierella sp. AD032]